MYATIRRIRIMYITSKYSNNCDECYERYGIGDAIWYTRGGMVANIETAEVEQQKANVLCIPCAKKLGKPKFTGVCIPPNLIPRVAANYHHNSKTKERIANKVSKLFVLYNPAGERVKIKNLHKFCRDNNLVTSCMHGLVSGLRQEYKGWTATGNKPVKRLYRFLDPRGNLVETHNLYAFCNANNLVQSCMRQLIILKNQSSHRGYTRAPDLVPDATVALEPVQIENLGSGASERQNVLMELQGARTAYALSIKASELSDKLADEGKDVESALLHDISKALEARALCVLV
jgi:hypothetical protein